MVMPQEAVMYLRACVRIVAACLVMCVSAMKIICDEHYEFSFVHQIPVSTCRNFDMS